MSPFHHIVHVERIFLPDPTPETTFDGDGEGTPMTMGMSLLDAQRRKAMLASGMEHGVEASYVRLKGMI